MPLLGHNLQGSITRSPSWMQLHATTKGTSFHGAELESRMVLDVIACHSSCASIAFGSSSAGCTPLLLIKLPSSFSDSVWSARIFFRECPIIVHSSSRGRSGTRLSRFRVHQRLIRLDDCGSQQPSKSCSRYMHPAASLLEACLRADSSTVLASTSLIIPHMRLEKVHDTGKMHLKGIPAMGMKSETDSNPSLSIAAISLAMSRTTENLVPNQPSMHAYAAHNTRISSFCCARLIWLMTAAKLPSDRPPVSANSARIGNSFALPRRISIGMTLNLVSTLSLGFRGWLSVLSLWACRAFIKAVSQACRSLTLMLCSSLKRSRESSPNCLIRASRSREASFTSRVATTK
mmetsp:Transcript_3596/g.8581  ORF Transcript_3596/g.8581 Transcript_3596/m.8581 type:complete len:347 (+) Transcript_3596:926-1966(+)